MSMQGVVGTTGNQAQLPTLCYAFQEGAAVGDRIVQVRAGESGMYATTLDQGAMTAAEVHELIDFLNGRLGVTFEQREAMIGGSMFGWHTRLADPAFYRGE